MDIVGIVDDATTQFSVPQRQKGNMNVKYAVIFERAQNNWAAYVPDLPGCMTTGQTLEDTRRNIREAIQGHLETLRDFGNPIPEPASVAGDFGA